MARTTHHPPIRSIALREEEEESGDEENAATSNANRQDRRIFESASGDPICFLLHKSLRSDRRIHLEEKIIEHGGMVVELLDNVDTMIVDQNSPTVDIDKLRIQFGCSRDPAMRKIHVEGALFISRCIGMNRYAHTVPVKQGLGGPTPHHARVAFSSDDDLNLCQYIASRRPEKNSGGRAGNLLYQELVNLKPLDEDDLDEYSWVKRHPWQSWRNRYITNQEALDPIIEHYVMAYPPEPRVVDHRDRRLGRASRHGRAPRNLKYDLGVQSTSEVEEDELAGDVGETEPTGGNASTNTQHRPDIPPVIHRRTAGNSGQDRSKGKGRALDGTPPELEEEALLSFNDNDLGFPFDNDVNMYNADEPGPSRTQQTPLLTQVSQRTLVEPSPRRISASQQESNNEVPNVQDNPPQAQAQSAVSGTPAVAVETDAPALRTRKRMQVAAEVASKASASVKSSGRVTRNAAARKGAAQPAVTVGDSAPYRNTRSRSRSVEPVSLEIRARSRKKAKPTLPVVQDVPEEEEADEEPPVGETLDEQFVVDHLVGDSLQAHDGSNEVGDVGDAAGESRLDSDDQQTDDALRGSSHVDDDESGSESENILAQLQKARKGQRGPATASVDIFTTRPPVAVASQGRKDHQPESSGESNYYPSPGTRAFKARTQLERKERRRPYEPPRGTRAAAVRR